MDVEHKRGEGLIITLDETDMVELRQDGRCSERSNTNGITLDAVTSLRVVLGRDDNQLPSAVFEGADLKIELPGLVMPTTIAHEQITGANGGVRGEVFGNEGVILIRKAAEAERAA